MALNNNHSLIDLHHLLFTELMNAELITMQRLREILLYAKDVYRNINTEKLFVCAICIYRKQFYFLLDAKNDIIEFIGNKI